MKAMSYTEKCGLVLFSSTEKEGRLAWPIHATGLSVDGKTSNLQAFTVDESGNVEVVTNPMPMNMGVNYAGGKVAEALRCLQGAGVRIFYAVHPRSLLIPMYKWHLMSRTDLSPVDVSKKVDMLMNRTSDLCEAFYRPSIITYEQRSGFGPGLVGEALGLEPRDLGDHPYSDHVLFELIMRIP